MHIVVTGAAGFSGRHLVRALATSGISVTALARRPDTDLLAHPHVQAAVGDLSSEAHLRSLPTQCDAIVHAAARSPPASNHELIADNVVATANLMDYALRSGARTMIYFSSLSVYGTVAAEAVSESTPVNAPTLYGVSKFCGEAMLRSGPSGLRSLSLRLPGIIGPGSSRNWLSSVLTCARHGRDIEFYRGSGAFNNAVYVSDLTRFVIRCLTSVEWNGHDIITLGAGGLTTVRRAVEIIADGFGARSKLVARDGHRHGFTISSARAERCYGYSPMAIEPMLRQFVADNMN